MVEKEITVERREYVRYEASNDASVLLKNGHSQVGQLLDISVDGLALIYVSSDKKIEGWFNIYLFGRDQFFLNNIPFKVISESLIEDIPLFNTMIKKRCSGQFGNLTSQQRSPRRPVTSPHCRPLHGRVVLAVKTGGAP